MTAQTTLRAALAAAILLPLSPIPAIGETIAVRSGEHGEFTRLVLDLPRPRNWTLDQNGSTARLTLSGDTPTFDLSKAFQKIDTQRVYNLQTDHSGKALMISLNCDCEIEAFRLGPQMLVLDVKDAVNSDGTTRQLNGAPPDSMGQRAELRPPTLKLPLPQGATGWPTVPTLSFGSAKEKPRPDSTQPPAATRLDQTISQKQPGMAAFERTKRVSEAEKRLAQQLSRAVSQGLVKPRSVQLPAIKPTPVQTPKTKPKSDPKTPAATPKAPGVNLKAQSSADRDFLNIMNGLPVSGTGAQCLSDKQLDVARWTKDQPFTQQLGKLRAQLLGEFDKSDPQSARKLSELYIHYGFGAEALHVLSLANFPDGADRLLLAMAEIMEYGHARNPEIFTSQFDCDTAAALWAVLAHESLPASSEPNEKAILRSVSGLPPHLRSHLGPMLSMRLRKAGHDSIAGQVLRLVERGAEAPDAPFEMAKAQQNLTERGAEAAVQDLQKVVESNTELSPKALITLIDTRFKANLPIDAKTAQLAEAYALEYRKDMLGAELKRVHILALAQAGDFDAAFQELRKFPADTDPTSAKAIRSKVMSALGAHGDDVQFLKRTLNASDDQATDLAEDSAIAVANRLLDLGFPERAIMFLDRNVEGVTSRMKRLVRARTALAQSKPRLAEAELIGLTGADADELRARALSMRGEHQAAQRLFGALQQKPDVIEQAWLAGDWATLRNTDDDLLANVANLATSTNSIPGDLPVLARDRALLSDSVTTRATLDAMLKRFSAEPSAPIEQ